MSDLVRFGVAMERALLGRFDERIAAKGYENRSEALRDLVRAELTRGAWEGGARVAATLTMLYVRRQRAEIAKVLDASGIACEASLVFPLDAERTLEVVVLRGHAAELDALSSRVGGSRGVLSSELTVACADAGPEAPSGRA
jgi:CopG family nickel-responsive transcriptional regulator